MVTLIKHQLFVQKLNNKIPNCSSLKKKIIQYYEDERYIYSISGMYTKKILNGSHFNICLNEQQGEKCEIILFCLS